MDEAHFMRKKTAFATPQAGGYTAARRRLQRRYSNAP